MATQLEELSLDRFRQRLESSGLGPVSSGLTAALYAHYEELRLWAATVALVGAGEAESIVERHYAESLRALPLLDGASRILDLGSGAGFPGLVLAAARPDAQFWLFESRGRKASFLRAATAKAELSCRIVDARVSRRLPAKAVLPAVAIELITVRGVKIDLELWAGLKSCLARGARIVRWEGSTGVAQWPDASAGRVVVLPGRGRKIQEWLT